MIRRARAADQADITALHPARGPINPRGLGRGSVVADDDGRIVGVAQFRLHSDGAPASLRPLWSSRSTAVKALASHLIGGLVSGDHARMHMLVDRPFAAHYQRWGFQPTNPRSLPGSMSRQYRIGRVVTSIGSLILRRRITMSVPLERP